MRTKRKFLKNHFYRATLLTGLAAILPGTALAELNWNLMGEAAGVEFYSARAGSAVRLSMINTNSYPVKVRVGEGIVWCGATRPGSGERQEVIIGEKKLKAGGHSSDPGWNHYQCDRRNDFYYELNEVNVARQ